MRGDARAVILVTRHKPWFTLELTRLPDRSEKKINVNETLTVIIESSGVFYKCKNGERDKRQTAISIESVYTL